MPTYSYACTSCDHRFDMQQGFADDPLTECPECSARLRKLFGSVGVVFKGSGFYRTDARADLASGRKAAANGGAAKSASAEASPSSKPPSGGTGSNGTAAPAAAAAKAAAD